MTGLVLASYRTDSIPYSQTMCVVAAAHSVYVTSANMSTGLEELVRPPLVLQKAEILSKNGHFIHLIALYMYIFSSVQFISKLCGSRL